MPRRWATANRSLLNFAALKMKRKSAWAVPDWIIQVAWYGSGVFGTGALWYFLSLKEHWFAGLSFFFALCIAVIAIALHRKKDAYAMAMLPDEIKANLPDDYVRRSAEQLEQVRLILKFPEMKRLVRESCRVGWESGVTLEMQEASFDMLDFLQFVWLKLAEFYPRKHFGRVSAEKYIEKYIRDQFALHWTEREPNGAGTGGTIVKVLTAGDVVADLEGRIEGMMCTLFSDCQHLDLNKWLEHWRVGGEDEALA